MSGSRRELRGCLAGLAAQISPSWCNNQATLVAAWSLRLVVSTEDAQGVARDYASPTVALGVDQARPIKPKPVNATRGNV